MKPQTVNNVECCSYLLYKTWLIYETRHLQKSAENCKSVQGQGPPPSLTFTHHPTNKDLWIAGAYGDDPGVVQQILEKIKDYVESRGYKAGMLYW